MYMFFVSFPPLLQEPNYNDINPFPRTVGFWHLCSRRLFKNIVTKGEIAQKEQFLLLPQCFNLFSVIKPSFIECYCVCAEMVSQSFAA